MAKSKIVKRAYKLLAECKDPRVLSAILNGAPDKLVKTICHAVLNVELGDIALNKRQMQTFKKHRKAISNLTSRSYSLGLKRKFLKQKGGAFPIIPILLSTALTALGSALFGANNSAQFGGTSPSNEEDDAGGAGGVGPSPSKADRPRDPTT